MTVDNASSNDTTVAYLKRRVVNWGTGILGGKYMHMRCVAHIINLVVKDGLKEMNVSIERVRTVVRYVRQSPARLRKFNEFVVEEKVERKKSLSLDVPTRWNSVYTMLETAVVFKNVFDRYEVSDSDFRADFGGSGPYANVGLPTNDDWVIVERFVKVLRYFYELTIRVSGSFYVTSNTFLDEISDVDALLREWLTSSDTVLVSMATQMKAKFDKYWGNIEKMNMFLYVADILDPRHKMSYMEYVLKNMYGPAQALDMASKIKSVLVDVFEEYKIVYGAISGTNATSSSSTTTMDSSSNSGSDEEDERARIRLTKRRYMQMLSQDGVGAQSELDLYLQEPITKDFPKFNILDWWKTNSYRFPVLSRLVRDVLGMPISTVASESAFSTGGRVIDDFRASLTPKMAQALICGQDWLRQNPPSSMAEDEEFLQRLEKDLVINSGTSSNILGM